MTTKIEDKTFREYLEERYEGPYMATDVLIRYNQNGKYGLVLIERKSPPFGLALPGGIAERMPLYKNAVKEAKEETGLDVKLDDSERPLCVMSELDQDPREFIASVSYVGTGNGILKPQEDEDAKSAFVFGYSALEELVNNHRIWAFKHHPKIILIFLEYERRKNGWKT